MYTPTITPVLPIEHLVMDGGRTIFPGHSSGDYDPSCPMCKEEGRQRQQPTDAEVEAVAEAIFPQLGMQEMVLADPLTLKRLLAKRVARAAIMALDEVRGK